MRPDMWLIQQLVYVLWRSGAPVAMYSTALVVLADEMVDKVVEVVLGWEGPQILAVAEAAAQNVPVAQMYNGRAGVSIRTPLIAVVGFLVVLLELVFPLEFLTAVGADELDHGLLDVSYEFERPFELRAAPWTWVASRAASWVGRFWCAWDEFGLCHDGANFVVIAWNVYIRCTN
jgi:hypothetical protein